MYTMLVFRFRLSARRFIVGASPDLKFRTTDEADSAHVVTSYWQLASRDLSFLPTSLKSPHSLRPMRARDTAYFEPYATDVFITPCLPPCFVEGCEQGKKCWYTVWWWILLFWNLFFQHFFCQNFFPIIFFIIFFFFWGLYSRPLPVHRDKTESMYLCD